jgi:DNA-binding NtrC family response regulator
MAVVSSAGFFSLPLRRSSPGSFLVRKATGMGKILIVDDDAATRLSVARILRGAGHAVVVADDGRQCLDLYRAAPADVVMLDLYMPDKDGLETLIELRREFPRVSVVAMSGHRQLELMLRAAKGLGAIRTIEKPFEPEALLALVAEELDWVRAGIGARMRDAGGAD